MKRKKGLIIIFILFAILFGYEYKEVSNNLFEESSKVNVEEEILNEYNNLTEEERNKITLEEYTKQYNENINLIISIFYIIITSIVVLIKYGIFFIFIIAAYFGYIKYSNKKYSKIDFTKEKEYYRDILKHYSADSLIYIDNLTLDYSYVLIAMLMQLKLKGAIEIKDNKIYINDNVNTEKLTNTEKYLIRCNYENKLIIRNTSDYETLVIKEGIDTNLLIKKESDWSETFKEFMLSISIYLITLITSILLWQFKLFSYLGLLVIIIIGYLIIYPIYLKIKVSTYHSLINFKPYFRTKQAEEINKKLEGLKNFLKDFSKLDERTSEEIKLWDEYLIYSVMFNQNENIVNEYKNLIIIK